MNFFALIIVVIVWSIVWVMVIAKRYQLELSAYWQEPVLKYPVIIFESDDWGAGPIEQSQALTDISNVLGQYTDKHKHHPVMTLGVVLSVPDADKVKKVAFKNYHDLKLDLPDFAPIKTAMFKGVSLGVFNLQLHGMAHYWPDNLMLELQCNKKLQQWLTSEEFPRTEGLPSVLQSRWVNTAQLPTSSLTQNEIDAAVQEEVNVFKKVFGFNPKVVVPPTFIWNDKVERSWKQQSINYLVTPGKCYFQRDKEGRPSGNDRIIVNSQESKMGLSYLVRNDYFEPSLGHTAEMAIKALNEKTKLAQPTLLEIHRFNFIQNAKIKKKSLQELDRVLFRVCEQYPNTVFLSTEELADKYLSGNTDYIEKSFIIRLSVCMERMWANYAIKKWLYLSGLFVPVMCLKQIRK